MTDDKSIYERYLDDPNAGNDVTETYYIPAVRGTTPIGLTLEQAAGIIQDRLGLAGNIGYESSFSMYVPDNTTVAIISPVVLTVAYTRYYIALDDSTAPTLTTDGSAGTIPVNYDLGDWDSHLVYLWVYSTSWVQVEPIASQSDGETVPGLVIKANNTAVPEFPAQMRHPRL